jgi:Cu(I)/Ag(I) efflux system membrane fusion protein
MKLVPVYAEGAVQATRDAQANGAGTVHVNAATLRLYGIQLSEVEESSASDAVRIYGQVAADESRVYRVDLGTDGYVKSTAGDVVGDHVTKNQRLAVVYSPDFLSVIGGYLSAEERGQGSGAKDAAASSSQNTASAQARADRLRNLGMSDAQIDEIAMTRKIPEDVYVVSPTDGFILARDISPGMRFEKHAEFYRIVDLSRVWIFAEVFGQDASAFRSGASVRVTLPDTAETFVAKVSNVLPEVDPVTRALKPRIEVENPSFHLRPGMFVDIQAPTTARHGLTIPIDAIVDTGLLKRVFVQTGEEEFVAREVKTGWSAGDQIQILQGLRKGDKVVSSGTFLIDSETRIHTVGE